MNGRIWTESRAIVHSVEVEYIATGSSLPFPFPRPHSANASS
jgi:hypothetical protein